MGGAGAVVQEEEGGPCGETEGTHEGHRRGHSLLLQLLEILPE